MSTAERVSMLIMKFSYKSETAGKLEKVCNFSVDHLFEQRGCVRSCLEFVCTDLLICRREPLMNQPLWPCGHTLPGHPQLQQNELQPTCRYPSATHSMSRLMQSEHTPLEVGPHGRPCASPAHHVLNFVVFASAFSGRSP